LFLAAHYVLMHANALDLTVTNYFVTSPSPCDCGTTGDQDSSPCKIANAYYNLQEVSSTFGDVVQIDTSCACRTVTTSVPNPETNGFLPRASNVVTSEEMVFETVLKIQQSDPSVTFDPELMYYPLVQMASAISTGFADTMNFKIPEDSIVAEIADAGTTFFSSQETSFDSSLREFCIHVMNFRKHSNIRMRPCKNPDKKKKKLWKKKQLWFIDSKGRMRNSAKKQWCVTWSGGKKRKLQLDLCESSAWKTTTFSYDADQMAIVVRNDLTGKKLLFGYGLKKKYGNIRLLPYNTKNYSAHSFLKSKLQTVLPSGQSRRLESSATCNVTRSPTSNPTKSITAAPIKSPTKAPTKAPRSPTKIPTKALTTKPTLSSQPSSQPSSEPSKAPSKAPSTKPTQSSQPSSEPSSEPSIKSWTLLDDNIDGEAIGDQFGTAVSLSDNGETVAVSAPYNTGNGNSRSGRVRVYELDSISGKWSQLGNDIDGEAAYDESGVSVSLSSNGDTVAIGSNPYSEPGHVLVYRLNDARSEWNIDGSFDGEANGDNFGKSVSLSSDGNTVAIGAAGNDGKGPSNSGNVRVYRYQFFVWFPLGDDVLDGEAQNDKFGSSVSLSSDGNTVAIGVPLTDGNGLDDSGSVRVYNLNDDSKWIILGDDILVGEAAYDNFGSSVSLSDNGETVAIAAEYNDGNGNNSGHVRVYEFNESLPQQWTILGDDIDGEVGDQFGSYVSLSGNGRTVAIGATGNGAGHVKVYKW